METKNLISYNEDEDDNYELIDAAIEKEKQLRSVPFEEFYKSQLGEITWQKEQELGTNRTVKKIFCSLIIFIGIIVIIILAQLFVDPNEIAATIITGIVSIGIILKLTIDAISSYDKKIENRFSTHRNELANAYNTYLDDKSCEIYSEILSGVDIYDFLNIPYNIGFKDGLPYDNSIVDDNLPQLNKYGSFTRFLFGDNPTCYHNNLMCSGKWHFNISPINIYSTKYSPCKKCAKNDNGNTPKWYMYYKILLAIAEKYPESFPNIQKDTEPPEPMAEPSKQETVISKESLRIYEEKLAELEREKATFAKEKAAFEQQKQDFEETVALATRKSNIEICVEKLVRSNFIPPELLPAYELSLETSRAEKAANPTFEFIEPISVSCRVRSATTKEIYQTSLTSCTCKDFIYNNRGKMPCKHMLALAFSVGVYSTKYDNASMEDEMYERLYEEFGTHFPDINEESL